MTNQLQPTKIIDVVNPQSNNEKEAFRETVLTEKTPEENAGVLMERMAPHAQTLWEAANTTSQFPYALKDGLRAILFDTYNEQPQTWPMLAQNVSSNKQFETWLEGSSLGKLPIVPENQSYPRAEINVDRAVQIRNDKRGAILPITWEMLRYDQTNVIRQLTQDLGRAMAYTKEDDFYTLATTAGNYVRTTAAGDNDVGNNTAATTFSAGGLVTALGVLRTMKDNKSGRYLGIGMRPLTLVVAAEVEFAAKQLLMSGDIQLGGDGNTTRLVYGTGTGNPFRGLVARIIVTPFLTAQARYGWILCEPGQAYVHQEVLPVELTNATNATDWNVHDRDVLEYKARAVYGFGMLNDRFAYYSSSTTAPTVA